MKTTKIAIDGTSALAQGGGIGRFTQGLLLGLAQVDAPGKRGDETSYILGYTRDVAHKPRFELPANFKWRSLGLSQKQAVWLWHRLRFPLPVDLWLGRPAIYHSPDYTLPPLARARGIVTVHDLSFERLPDVHEPRLRAYLRRAVPHSIRRADHVFADSESTRQDIMAYYNTEPAKISVVYPGVEERFRPLDATLPADAAALEETRRTLALERPFIVNVGTIEPRKNNTSLIRAFAAYRATGNQALELVLAGGGGWLGERERLQELVHQLGLDDHVRFTGFVADDLLPALLNLAQAVVYPSLYEGFGLPVLEALACGTPVITAHNSSLPEAGGEAAAFIEDALDTEELANKLAIILHDDSERQRMSRAGLSHASTFTWQRTARQVIDLYQQVLAE